MDQLHGVLTSKSLDKIVFVTASEANQSETPLAAAIAIQQTASETVETSDMATIVHAGMLQRSEGGGREGDAQHSELIQALSNAVDEALYRRGTRFLQWPTDASDRPDDEVARWCQGFGFQSVGTLDYLGGPAELAPDSPLMVTENHELRFDKIDWNRDEELQRFAALVESTYKQTLDCPNLAAYRTAAQTLRGYQASSAFDADHWFTVVDDSGAPIGCLVLAIHHSASQSEGPLASVVEIVYMGLVPESRGQGRGKVLVQRAFQAARNLGADRMILAVDRQNEPARSIYALAGLQPILRETVWVKSLNREE
jgi:GNAT superfamily N-acetyltransferase